MSGYSMAEFFGLYGITPDELLKGIGETSKDALKITASQICKITGDGSVTQERINATDEYFRTHADLISFDTLFVKGKEYPELQDYLYIIHRIKEAQL